jgi:CelD/BcsL family acetyltransferase involved in cellulose biosynthesis
VACTDYTIEVISNNAALANLEIDWNRLSEAAGAPNVFTTFGWFQAWSARLSEAEHSSRFCPHVLVLKQDEAVAGVCPLTYRWASRFGFAVRKLEFSAVFSDYNDLVLGGDPGGQISAVVNYLAHTSEQWDVLDLRDLRDTGDGIALLKSALARAGLHFLISKEQEGCPYISINGDAACLMERLSGRRRKHLRKQGERASVEGLNIRIIESPQDEPRLLEKLVELEWKKNPHSSSGTFVGAYPEVFQSLFETLGPRGWLYVAMLELRGQAIAFQLGFRCGSKLWDYTKAYDRSFSRFAPGTLLLPALLDYGFEHGFNEYDFLRGEEPYKTVWSTGCHRRFRLLVWNQRRISRVRKFVYYDLKNAIYSLLGVAIRSRPSASSRV